MARTVRPLTWAQLERQRVRDLRKLQKRVRNLEVADRQMSDQRAFRQPIEPTTDPDEDFAPE